MSSKGRRRSLKLDITKDKPSKIIKDLPRLNYESDSSFDTELDESDNDELETFSDPDFTTGSCSGSDTEVFNCENEVTIDTICEAEKVSLTSCESDEEERARKSPGKEVSVDLSFESDCSNYSPTSSNITLDSNDNFFIENNLPGSSSSANLEQVCPDVPEQISEGFNRLKELVSELLAVDGTKTKIEENGKFVHGLLKQLSLHSESNTLQKVVVKTKEETNAFVRKKNSLNDLCLTKCATDVNESSEPSVFGNDDKLGDNLKKINEDLKDEVFAELSDHKVPVKFTPPPIFSNDVQFINEIPVTTAPFNFITFSPNPSKCGIFSDKCDAVDISCSTSPNIKPINSPLPSTAVIPLANSSDIPPSSPVDASFDTSSEKLDPFRSSSTTTGSVVLPTPSSIALTVPEVLRSTVPVSINPRSCVKSRYEMIREDIIAERNEQLKAMGFFEEFSVLRSEMIPKKTPKAKKKASEFKEKREVRRSERLFLSSPELDQTYSKCKTDDAVVKNIIEEILTSVRQDKINSESGSCQVRCEECGKRFNKRRLMMDHVRRNHRKKINLRCQICDYMTFRSSRLQTHMKLHSASDTENKVYSCDLCDCVVKFRNNLIRHRYNVHKLGKKPVKRTAHSCEQCEFVTNTLRNLIKHKSRVHKEDNEHKIVVTKEKNDKVYSCDQCDYEVQYRSRMIRHRFSVHKLGEQPPQKLAYSCEHCDFVTKNIRDFRRHNSRLHNEIFKLKAAVIKKASDKVYSCDQCNFNTKHVGNLQRHKSKLHKLADLENKDDVTREIEGKIFSCDQCSFVTKHLGLFWRHKCQVHKLGNLTDRVLFNDRILDVKSCDQCNFVTLRESNLWKHKRNVHKQASLRDKELSKDNSIQPYSCNIECQNVTDANMADVESDTDSVEIFTDDSDEEEAPGTPVKQIGTCVFEIEEKELREEKIWSCETCGNVYADKDSLNVHKKNCHKF